MNFTVTKDRDGFFVVLDPSGYTVKRPEDAAKIRSEQLPITFKTEVAALAAAAKFQQAEEDRMRQTSDAESKNSKERIARMGAESDRLRQAAEERRNLASATGKVRELSNEIVTTERDIRTVEATISALEGQLLVNRIDLTNLQDRLVALQDALKSAKGN